MTIMPPSNVDTGTVVGRFITAVVDGPDVGSAPDFISPVGTVTFTASVTKLLNATAAPAPVTVLKTSIVAVLDDEGYVCTPDADGAPAYRGVHLVATDDEDLNPTGWVWRVNYSLRQADGKQITNPAQHSIAVPAGTTVDLTTVIPPDGAQVIGVPQAEAAAAIASQAVLDMQAAVAVITASVVDSDSFIANRIETPGSDTATALGASIETAVDDPTTGPSQAIARKMPFLNVKDYASVQACLDVAPAGSTVYFPPDVYAIPSGGFVLKSSGLTIEALGAEFEVSNWGTPAFLGLRSNSGADDQTYRLGIVRYVGTRGNHLGTLLRGSAPYCSGCAVWTNGDRNFVERVRTIGMPTPIFFSSWDGTSSTDRTGVGNRIGYMEAEGYDFALLYVKQVGYDWGDAYCHDDIDDSSGANPTHAIYGSASDGHRAGTGSVGKWITERNLYGAAYQFKYSDRVSFDALIAHDTKGVLSILDCDDLRGSKLSGTLQSAAQGAVSFAFTTAPSKRPVIESMSISQAPNNDTRAISLWADDGYFGTITINDARATTDVNAMALLVRGNRTRVETLVVKQAAGTSKAASIGNGSADTVDCTIGDVIQPGVFLPVSIPAATVGARWGQDGVLRGGAAPTTGTWQRGQMVFSSAPSASAPLGWVCTVAGTPGTWKAMSNLAA